MKDIVKAGMIFIMGTIILFPTYTFAYLDPGSGSMILQLILAGLASVAVIVRVFWSKIKGFLGLNKPKEDISTLAKQDSKK